MMCSVNKGVCLSNNDNAGLNITHLFQVSFTLILREIFIVVLIHLKEFEIEQLIFYSVLKNSCRTFLWCFIPLSLIRRPIFPGCMIAFIFEHAIWTFGKLSPPVVIAYPFFKFHSFIKGGYYFPRLSNSFLSAGCLNK